MKRICFLLVLAIFVSLAGCRASTPDSQDMLQKLFRPGQTHTEMEGIEIRIADVTWDENSANLKVEWVNQTEYDAIYGASYSIERKEDGKWVSCAMTEDLIFDALAYALNAGQTRSEVYQLAGLYDVSRVGTYRFGASCFVYTSAEESRECKVWAEFEVGSGGDDSGNVQTADLMHGIRANNVTGKAADEAFLQSQMRLAVELFQACTGASKDENVLISPLSIQLALAMTANGAVGQTREEMETLLGGEIPLEELNAYLHSYVKSLPSAEQYKLGIANSIWFRDEEGRLQVEQDFLQHNADYYGAQIRKEPFDDQTLKDINSWVEEQTDGMIAKILEKINEDAAMYLINAMVFDAQWENVYDAASVYKGDFTNIAGEKISVDRMHSEEKYYLRDGQATGFIKAYKDGKYSFAALLPNKGVNIYDYISGLTGEDLLEMLANAKSGTVLATLPKFSSSYELTMNAVLKELGMPTAFESDYADFSGMAQSPRGNIFIGNVLHKTFISVDELGTKAGAVTSVEMSDGCTSVSDHWVVTLDRPFVYMIIDNATNLPVFIGTVMDIQ